MNILHSISSMKRFHFPFRMKGDDLERRSDMINRELRVLMSVEGELKDFLKKRFF